MKTALAKILGSILRSLFVSVVMFVIVFSVITREFPPNFSKLQNSWQSLQKMAQLSRQIHDQHQLLKGQQAAGDGFVEDADLDKLQELNLRRAELGASLLNGTSTSGAESSAEDQALKRRVQELEQQLFKLQQRVNELEARAKHSGS
ncbi:hypothetical protein EZJ49_00195 [Bdellovibrio bacteriovorus]|uniref:hypothetical protein n=1 Tax=Bdellovibrio bacteriovorus TaxID=959 RepID=UPI0021D2725A|nr:hypothetical protein [Bdellovibrio bacteriovorus]UXR64674.1 hypothetical protein EZJ49_00195 [Bdellovibrio bacteriovorus]